MSSQTQTYFLCLVLLLFTVKTAVAHSDDLHHQLYQNPVANDLQSKETIIRQKRSWPVSSPTCPQRCSCKTDDTHHIISVDCSSKGLTMVPALPKTTVDLSLMNNAISTIACESFKLLSNLENLNLASNKIKRLRPCVFVSQSSSLLNLKISDNDIKIVDVKLFQNLSRLETLDLSGNVIKHLASRTFLDLVHLVTLNLSFNYIKSIAPDAFKGLHFLKTLSLFNNQLDGKNSFHKDVFQDLGALETLDVKANLGSIDEAVAALRNVSHLYIEVNQNYEVLGSGFRQLASLRVLNLNLVYIGPDTGYKDVSNCYLETAPSNFFANIRTGKDFELHLSACELTMMGKHAFVFPSTLVSLNLRGDIGMNFALSDVRWTKNLINTKIHTLDLSLTYYKYRSPFNNYIYDWCFEYLGKTNLKTLNLSYNRIARIELQRFPRTIEKLDISYNSIGLLELYITFNKLMQSNFKLKELRADCQIYECFEITAKQISQQTLYTNIVGGFNASNTHFKRLDNTGRRSTPSELPQRVFPNVLQILDKSIGSMRKTMNSQHAVVADVELPKVFNKEKLSFLQNLKEQDPDIYIIYLPSDLEVVYANLAIHSFEFSSVRNIRILDNTVLRHVELIKNNLNSLLGPVENVPSLQYLDLSRNQCRNLSVYFFKYMVGLQTLMLDYNAIGPSLAADVNGLTFSTLINLNLLNVSHNTIKDLSSLAFINNRNLETLDLSNNQLSEFQPTLSTMCCMSTLDLSVNLLPGLSEQTSEELKLLKSRNQNFTVNILNNRLLFTCDYLPFLHLVISEPSIFFRVKHLHFKSTNETQLSYIELANHFPLLARECMAQRFFILILIIFFVAVGTVTICAVIYHKRWKLRYLYYTSRRRMHIGEHAGDYTPDADVFLTYDQDDLRWRRFMQQTFLPGLNQRNITYVLGETDFPGGDVMAHVTGAVIGTRKTVVILSMDIFDDHHREFEMNLSIMREIDTRSLKIVPIFVEDVDLALYPREIEIFLRNQWERCLSYSDTDDFWDSFVGAVREDD